jgi:hypothetical protein
LLLFASRQKEEQTAGYCKKEKIFEGVVFAF